MDENKFCIYYGFMLAPVYRQRFDEIVTTEGNREKSQRKESRMENIC
jgi:hypothetical protein